MSLFQTPAFFGIHDAMVDDVPDPFGLRIYYPTRDDLLLGAPVARGPHPLVVFAHGNRQGSQNAAYCPDDKTNDYRRWTRVLGAIARSGFVVAAPDLSAGSTEERLEASVRWMRGSWSGRRSIHTLELAGGHAAADARRAVQPADALRFPAADADPAIAGRPSPAGFLGQPTSLSVIGHSWGARDGAVFAQGNGANSYVSIAGSFDDNASIEALRAFAAPKFMLAGTEDHEASSYLHALWNSLHAPKYQCAVRGASHWDWFGGHGAIRRCDGTPAQWPDTAHVAGELIAGFLTRHVGHLQFTPPPFIRIPLLRPWHVPWVGEGTAIQMRWDAPGQSFGTLDATGSGILGEWPAGTAQDW